MSKKFFDIRVACMFAVLMVGAACAEAVKDVGASLEIDPRLSLSEEREYKSWASYIRAQLCRADESFGLKNYHRYIGDALNFAPESEYLLEQWCLGRDLARQPERHVADLKPIWEEHPESVRLTMLYLDLLIQSGQDRKALEAVLFSLERCGWRSGLLTLRYVELVQVAGRSPFVEKNLRHALHVCEKEDLTCAHVAAACYWRDCYNSEKESGEAEGIGRFKRFRSNLASSRYRRKSLWHAREAAAWPGDLEAMSAFALSTVFSSFGCWEEQVEFLEDLSDDEGRSMDKMVWWFMDYVRALRELKREEELKEALEGIQFGQDWNHRLLETAAEAYLEMKDYGRACEMFEMLSQKEPGNLRYRLMVAHICLASGQSVKGLAALAPLRGLPPVGCELKARLLAQHGEQQKAYDEYMALLKIDEKGDLREQWRPRAPFYDGLVMTCLGLGKKDEALQYVKALYEMDPEDAHGCNFYGYLLADFNRELDLAEKLVGKALSQEPDNPAYLDSMAWIRYRQGRHGEALAEMCKVLENNGLSQDPDGEISEHLAAILKALGCDATAEYYRKLTDSLKK
jgi:tetratricopeptide (TPR) repeat protein